MPHDTNSSLLTAATWARHGFGSALRTPGNYLNRYLFSIVCKAIDILKGSNILKSKKCIENDLIFYIIITCHPSSIYTVAVSLNLVYDSYIAKQHTFL